MFPFRPIASLVQDPVNEDGAVLGRLLSRPGHAATMRPSLSLDEVPNALTVSIDKANVLVR